MVKNNVEELGGSVTVDSQIGRGTEFHLKIALTRTLVTKESLFIEDQGKFFTVPSAEVERVVELNRDQLRDHDGHLIAVIQDAVYYFRTLNDCFDSTYGHNKNANVDKCPEKICGLLLRNQRVGLLVEKVLGFNKIVVKNFEHEYFENIPALEGFTIRGDGQVVTVINLEEILSGI